MIPRVKNYLTLCIALVGAMALTGCGGGSDGDADTTDTTTTGVQEPFTGPYSGDEIETCVTCHDDDRLVDVNNYHGRDVVAAEENLVGNRITTTITNVTADGSGVLTVEFSAEDQDGAAYTGLSDGDVDAALAKLVNGDWVPYFYSTESPNDWAASHDGPDPLINGAALDDEIQQGGRDRGTLTNNGDGTYVYIFDDQNLTDNATPDVDDPDGTGPIVPNTAIGYDNSITHRVSLMMGGHSGATDQSFYDFVPDGSAVSDTRNIVSTTACLQCHGDEFHGHGGDRLVLEGCVTCHNPSTFDSGSGPDGAKEIMDAKVLFHRIHMGSSLPTTYQLSHRGHTAEWSDLGFPADVRNCTKCHYEPDGETLEDVDNWQTPSQAACGSCHSDVNFETGENHDGGIQTDDSQCTLCHNGDYAPSVKTAHAVQRTYDFDVALSMTAPANGTHYVAGEEPVVTVVLSDPDTGDPIDHTTMTEEKFQGSGHPAFYLFVNGPRAERKPVLTTAAAENSGHYAGNPLYLHTDSSEDDPNVTVSADQILYQLDAIPDDMTAGTYVAYVHAGMGPDYASGNTHSTALTTFQVGTATEEAKIAEGCSDCHGLPDADSVDWGVDNVMHGSRPFDVDYCGSCHDYQVSDDGEGWAENRNGFGAAPISRRVHRVHSGASEDGGRDFSHIGFPQSVKMCTKCHTDDTSGTWHTNPGRLACTGCHESETATTHTAAQTWDPTP